MTKLHALQEKILKLFEQNQNTLPSYRDIAKKIGVSSTNTIAHHIKQLKKQGYLGFGANLQIKSGIVAFQLRNLLSLDGRAGVYVLLETSKARKTPFYIGKAMNIKNDLLNVLHTALDSDRQKCKTCVLAKLKGNLEHVEIAFHLVDDSAERSRLYQHLLDFYKKEGFFLCND